MEINFGRHTLSWATLFICFTTTLVLADTMVLKDGQVFQGRFKGGTESEILFEVAGTVKSVKLGDITSLTFSHRDVQSAPTEQQAGKSQAGLSAVGEAPTGPITILAGTKMMLKLDTDVSTATHNAGTKVTAILENDLVVNGVVAISMGSKLYGTVVESRGGKRVGKQILVIQFDNIMIDNQLVPIITDQLGAEGGSGGAMRKVGAGALIGSAAGDAKAGAAVSAGLALLGPGNHIKIPAGTLAEVSLKQPLTLQK